MTLHDRTKPSNQTDDLIATASGALFRLGRAFGRQPARDLSRVAAGDVPDLSAILVVQAIAAAEARSEEATIGVIAAELGIDPSTASRLVAQTEARGYLARRASQRDGRASILSRSPSGEALEQAAAAFQRQVFLAATADWSEAERQAFAARFAVFAEAIITALYAARDPETTSPRNKETLHHAAGADGREPLA